MTAFFLFCSFKFLIIFTTEKNQRANLIQYYKPIIMKRILFFTIIAFLSLNAFSQTFNTGKLLKSGQFSAGINPVFYEKDLGIFLHGGYGISKKVDLGVKYGVFDGSDYIGADLEWAMKGGKRYALSLITGAHMVNDLGLDAGACISFNLGTSAVFFTGVDADLEFGNDFQHYIWIPLGVELSWKGRMSIILEGDLPMSEWAWNILGGGVAFYF